MRPNAIVSFVLSLSLVTPAFANTSSELNLTASRLTAEVQGIVVAANGVPVCALPAQVTANVMPQSVSQYARGHANAELTFGEARLPICEPSVTEQVTSRMAGDMTLEQNRLASPILILAAVSAGACFINYAIEANADVYYSENRHKDAMDLIGKRMGVAGQAAWVSTGILCLPAGYATGIASTLGLGVVFIVAMGAKAVVSK